MLIINPSQVESAGADLAGNAGDFDGLARDLHDAFSAAASASGHPSAAEAANRSASSFHAVATGLGTAVNGLGTHARSAGTLFSSLDDSVMNFFDNEVR